MDNKELPSREILMKNIQSTIKNAWNVENKIHQLTVEKWLKNFTGEALSSILGFDISESKKLEQQLALFLLCNFVYYNESEVKYLVKLLLNKYIHAVYTKNKKEEVNGDELKNLIKHTQFTYLGDVSESSSYLLYLFRQENNLSKRSFKENPDCENIVFIDDFSITGSQADQYIRNYCNSHNHTDKNLFAMFMIATEDAVSTLESKTTATVLSCIQLDVQAKAFSKDSIIFQGYESKYREMAKEMCQYYGQKITTSDNGMTPLGFDSGEYMFGAYYNIPDNALPVFWSTINNWSNLFERHDKVYREVGASIGGYYV